MEDVFGKVLMDFLKGEKNPHVIRRDDGYADEKQAERYFWPYIKWPDYEREILKEVKGRVLDIGAGAGRHSLWLQSRGFEVHAIDISPLAVEVMKTRGIKNVHLMPLQRLNFPDCYFDSVLLMFNNFGLGGTIEGTKKMLEKVHKITGGNGQIITTINDPTKTDKPEHLAYQKNNLKKGKPIGQVTIRHEYKGEKGDWFDLLMVSPEELEDLVKGTGWQIVRLVIGNDGRYGVVLKKVG